MKSNIPQKITTGFLISLLMVASIGPAFAQSAMPKTLKSTANQQARIEKLITRGDTEVAKRLADLTAVIAKINALVKLSDSQKNTITVNLQNNIASLTAVKAKIDADTDLVTLRSDVMSILTANRTYLLILPQAHIVAASDRVQDVVDAMSVLTTKLQARITQAQAAGKNTASLQTSLTDMQTKITDAQTQSQSALNLVISLVPDAGDKAVLASNNQAIKTAHNAIKAANTDIKAAFTDAKSIVASLKAMK